jgi:hypothetical protein
MTTPRKLLLVTVFACLALANSAQAATPTLSSVGQQDRHPTANFSAPGADSAYMSVASSPARASDGSFLSENLEDYDVLTDSEIYNGYWSSLYQLAAGTYYVMVDASTYDESECGQYCTNGYSNVMTLTIPGTPPPAVDQCFDGIDNDGDGLTDLSDMDNYPNPADSKRECDEFKPVPQTETPQPQPTPKAKKTTPTLSMSDAKHYSKVALKRKFKGAYKHGSAKYLKGAKRVSRTKVRFNRVSWFAGDTSWAGRMTIWLTGVGSKTRWNYAYTITRTDGYCKFVLKKSHCTKTYRVT